MSAPSADQQVRTLLEQSQALVMTDAGQASVLAGEAVRLARDLGDAALEIDALLDESWALYWHGELTRAVETGRAGLLRAQELRDVGLTAMALHILGMVFDGLGDQDRAMTYLVEALKLREQAGHAQARLRVLNSIGVLYSRSGQTEEGLRVYREVLAEQRRRNAPINEQLSSLNNMGINLKNLGRLEEAETVLNEALSLPELSSTARANLLHNLAEVFTRQERWDEAESHQRISLALATAAGAFENMWENRLALTQVLLRRGVLDETGDLLEAAASQLDRLPGQQQARWHAARAELAQARGDHAAAYEAMQRSATLEREAFQAQAERRLHRLQVSHELEQARQTTERERAHRTELEGLLSALREADELKSRLVERLDRLAREDALTGLANRRAFNEWFADAYVAARATEQQLSVALLDLDNFKRVNDTHGHATGDAVLQAAAAVLARHARPGWLAARYGGEEFALVMPGLGAAEAARVCDALRADLAAQPWAEHGLPWTQTTSVGLSDDPSAPSPERLLSLADHWLYQAKHNGKNRVCRA